MEVTAPTVDYVPTDEPRVPGHSVGTSTPETDDDQGVVDKPQKSGSPAAIADEAALNKNQVTGKVLLSIDTTKPTSTRPIPNSFNAEQLNLLLPYLAFGYTTIETNDDNLLCGINSLCRAYFDARDLNRVQGPLPDGCCFRQPIEHLTSKKWVEDRESRYRELLERHRRVRSTAVCEVIMRRRGNS